MNLEKHILKRQKDCIESFRYDIGENLEHFPYGFWVSPSFKRNVDLPTAEIEAQKWLKFVSRSVKGHLLPYMCCEPEFSHRRTSLHGIILSEVVIPNEFLNCSWRGVRYSNQGRSLFVQSDRRVQRFRGNNMVCAYNHNLGANEYSFLKHISLPFSVICPEQKTSEYGCRKSRKGRVCKHPLNGVLTNRFLDSQQRRSAA